MYNKGLILVVLVSVCIPMLLARRNNKEGHERNHGEKKHNCTGWNYGPCVFKNGATCGAGKKTGTPTNEDCLVKEKIMHCKVPCSEDSAAPGCRYKKQRASRKDKSTCDPTTNKYPVTMKLARGSPMTCPETKVVYENCRRRQERAANKRIGERKPGGRKQKQDATTTPVEIVPTSVAAIASVECKYKKVKGSKPVCDPTTKTKTITKQLKKNSPSTCEQTKTMTESCKPAEPKGKKPGRKGPQPQ